LTSSGDLTFYNGILYASVNQLLSDDSWLATIDTKTGLATLIGDFGPQSVMGLEVRNQIMYAATREGRVLQVDPTSTGWNTVPPTAWKIVGTNGIVQAGLAKSP
jgi:hypothetical protein